MLDDGVIMVLVEFWLGILMLGVDGGVVVGVSLG